MYDVVFGCGTILVTKPKLSFTIFQPFKIKSTWLIFSMTVTWWMENLSWTT